MRILAFCFAFIVVMGTGCKRYTEGPGVSLRSPKARVVNVWRMYKCFENGAERTENFNAIFPNWKLSIAKDETYVLSYNIGFSSNTYTENGRWEFVDGPVKINLKKDGTETNIWTIKRLANNELWAEQREQDGDLIEYRLRP